MSLLEKVVLITGGSSDIKAITAVSFAKEGASVAIVGRKVSKLVKIAKHCEELGAETLAIVADVSKDEEADLIVKKTIDIFGKLDVLVNHAGITEKAGILEDHFLKTIDKVVNTNMRGIVRITYFAAPHLIKTKGHIINISSMAGISITKAFNVAYRTSKAAMIDFTRSVALELAPHGVRVNVITPGLDLKAFIKSLKNNLIRMQNITAPKRLSKPNDIADMILYIASGKCKHITGTNFWHQLPSNKNKTNAKIRNLLTKQVLSFEDDFEI